MTYAEMTDEELHELEVLCMNPSSDFTEEQIDDILCDIQAEWDRRAGL